MDASTRLRTMWVHERWQRVGHTGVSGWSIERTCAYMRAQTESHEDACEAGGSGKQWQRKRDWEFWVGLGRRAGRAVQGTGRRPTPRDERHFGGGCLEQRARVVACVVVQSMRKRELDATYKPR